jgi:hypothetical protein
MKDIQASNVADDTPVGQSNFHSGLPSAAIDHSSTPLNSACHQRSYSYTHAGRQYGSMSQPNQLLVIEIRLVDGARIILILIAVVVVIHVLSPLLGMSACFNLVIFVQALGLSELVNFTSNKTGEEFFGKGVVDCLAWCRGQCLQVLVVVAGHIPSRRCLSSNSFIPSNAAAPPMSSWENLPS